MNTFRSRLVFAAVVAHAGLMFSQFAQAATAPYAIFCATYQAQGTTYQSRLLTLDMQPNQVLFAYDLNPSSGTSGQNTVTVPTTGNPVTSVTVTSNLDQKIPPTPTYSTSYSCGGIAESTTQAYFFPSSESVIINFVNGDSVRLVVGFARLSSSTAVPSDALQMERYKKVEELISAFNRFKAGEITNFHMTRSILVVR